MSQVAQIEGVTPESRHIKRHMSRRGVATATPTLEGCRMSRHGAVEVLGLDLALSCGWARVVEGGVFERGVNDFRGARGGRHNGYAFAELYAWLGANTQGDTQLCYELAHHRGGPATRLACGWQATVQLFAARRGLPAPLCVATMTLKKWATGSGRAGKEDVMRWAGQRVGDSITDDNEADAVAVALWGYEQRAQKILDHKV